jgi:hypothetical protein
VCVCVCVCGCVWVHTRYLYILPFASAADQFIRRISISEEVQLGVFDVSDAIDTEAARSPGMAPLNTVQTANVSLVSIVHGCAHVFGTVLSNFL